MKACTSLQQSLNKSVDIFILLVTDTCYQTDCRKIVRKVVAKLFANYFIFMLL